MDIDPNEVLSDARELLRRVRAIVETQHAHRDGDTVEAITDEFAEAYFAGLFQKLDAILGESVVFARRS